MIESSTEDVLRDALREAVLSLGGVFAARSAEDGLVRDVASALGRALGRHLSRGAGTSASMDPTRTEPRPARLHPAIVELLARIGHRAAPTDAPRARANHEWLRLPGLFRRWEFEQVIDVDEEFLVEEAGHDEQGMALFAIFTRPHVRGEGAP